jgi:hypothetical protein
MKSSKLPLAGILASLALFTNAASHYPGGYRFTGDFISTLFAPLTPSGINNAARPIAILAMLVFCASVGLLFQLVSRQASSRVLAKIIQIGGVGSMVYAFLVVTPMHDLLVGIALLFFFPAVFATLALVYQERRVALFSSGLVCLGLMIVASTMYYGHVAWQLLPLAQKSSMGACTCWLLVLQLSPTRQLATVELLPAK